LEVLGLLILVGFCGFFFAWAAGTCIEMPEDWCVCIGVGVGVGLSIGVSMVSVSVWVWMWV